MLRDAFTEGVHQQPVLSRGWCFNPPEARTRCTVNAVQEQHVEVNVEIARQSKALNQRHGAGLGGSRSAAALSDQITCNRASDDAVHCPRAALSRESAYSREMIRVY